jgi:phage terminase large subunit GpA-like protein
VRYSPAVYSAFAPPPKLQLSTWMEEHIRLPAGDAAVPGRMRLYGYQRGIADAIGDPLIERVTVIKSARIGYTTLLVGALANYVHNDPSSLMCALAPNDGLLCLELCRRRSVPQAWLPRRHQHALRIRSIEALPDERTPDRSTVH